VDRSEKLLTFYYTWTVARQKVKLMLNSFILLQVEGLLLVVTHSSLISIQRRRFKADMADCLELVNEQTSCHQAIGESLHELRVSYLTLLALLLPLLLPSNYFSREKFQV
jgi:hypothetical protein